MPFEDLTDAGEVLFPEFEELELQDRPRAPERPLRVQLEFGSRGPWRGAAAGAGSVRVLRVEPPWGQRVE